MAFQSVPNTAEAVINYVGGSIPMVNRLNFEHAGPYSQGDIDNLAAAVDLAVDAYFLPLIGNTVQYLFTKARGLENPIDLEATNATSSGNGSAAGNQLPYQTSYVIKLGTGATGRSARGRLYAPPPASTALTSARTVTTTFSNAWVDAIADLLTDVLVAGWTGVITSRVTGGAPRPVGLNRPITDVIGANLNVDTQRRRVGK